MRMMPAALQVAHPTLAILNPQQQDAVMDSFEGHLMTIAGAGSGKTRVATHRGAFLLADKRTVSNLPATLSPAGESPYSILMLTFTNKAGDEMKERMGDLVGKEMATKIKTGTFHSLCVWLLRKHFAEAGFEKKEFTILDADDQLSILKEICRADDPSFGASKESGERLKALQGAISDWKNDLKGPETAEMEMTDERVRWYVRMYYQYQARLRRDACVDFDELIMRTVKTLRLPDSEMRQYCHSRFRWIQVDEFQDTNEAQYQLVKELASPFANIFCVGDDKQGIYSWRGARVKNVKRFLREFHGKLKILTMNYRSQAKIVWAANHLIAHNPDQIPMQAEPVKPAGENIKLHVARNAEEEARFIAGEILNRRSSGITYDKIAILFRMNHHTGVVERALAQVGIPYEIVNGVKFFERRVIKDTIAGLIMIYNPAASEPARRTAALAKGVGRKTMAEIQALSDRLGLSFLSAMKAWWDDPANTDTRARNAVGPFMKTWSDTWRDILPRLGPALPPNGIASTEWVEVAVKQDTIMITDVIERVWRNRNIGHITPEGLFIEGDAVTKASKTPEELDVNRKNLMEFYGMAKRFQEKPAENTVADFLENIALVSQGDKDQQANKVKLMTVHASKGLEFPVVFIAAFEDNVFPSSRTKGSPEQLDEERRLAYVAITRAGRECYLTRARERMFFNNPQYNGPSQFEQELPAQFVEEV